jgi:hypothetical protein
MTSFYRFVSLALLALVVGCGGADVEVETDADTSGSTTAGATGDTGRQAPATGDSGASAPQTPMERPNVSPEEQNRIEAWLAAYADSLNDYGDPKGTMYAGGTPLFNETSGQPVSKYEYIVAKHPAKPWNQPLPTNRPAPKPDAKKDSARDDKEKDGD